MGENVIERFKSNLKDLSDQEQEDLSSFLSDLEKTLSKT